LFDRKYGPMGIHTGDSIVSASNDFIWYYFPKNAWLCILMMRSIGNFAGGCNVQFAVSPDERRYCSDRNQSKISRSSALASKATGYPIAKSPLN
jgi:carbamoyl-phosphate synthase large subunit